MKQIRQYCSATDKLLHDPACKEEIMAMATQQKKIHISKRGIITGSAAAAVLLAVNIGVGSFLYSQQKALDTASNENAEVSEMDLLIKEEPLQTTVAAVQTVTETTATTAKEKTEKSVTTKKDTKETKTTTAAKKDGKQAAVTTAAKNSGNQTAATTAAPKTTQKQAAVTTVAPKTTTAKRTTTTAKMTTTKASQTTAAPTTTTAVQKPPVTDRLIYNLVPGGKTGWTPAYENDLANNVYRAQPGEELRVDLKVKNDPGTGYVVLGFEFGEVQLLRTEVGGAYAGQYGPSLLGNDDLSLPGVIDFMCRNGQAMHAADDSVMASFYVKVPQKAGRYTVMLDGDDSRVMSHDSRPDEGKYQNFTYYGLDILVGDTPMPGTAQPMTSEPYYEAEKNETPATTEPAAQSDVMDVPNYNSPAEVGDKMAIGVEQVTAHAGDKHVPVRVYVKNNVGVTSLGLRLIHSSGISAEPNGRKLLFVLDPAYADCVSSASENPSKKIWGFCLIGGESITSDGTVLTFYVDIPDTASTGDVFKIYTYLEAVITDRPVDSDSICTVNGSIRIVD